MGNFIRDRDIKLRIGYEKRLGYYNFGLGLYVDSGCLGTELNDHRQKYFCKIYIMFLPYKFFISCYWRSTNDKH